MGNAESITQAVLKHGYASRWHAFGRTLGCGQNEMSAATGHIFMDLDIVPSMNHGKAISLGESKAMKQRVSVCPGRSLIQSLEL